MLYFVTPWIEIEDYLALTFPTEHHKGTTFYAKCHVKLAAALTHVKTTECLR